MQHKKKAKINSSRAKILTLFIDSPVAGHAAFACNPQDTETEVAVQSTVTPTVDHWTHWI